MQIKATVRDHFIPTKMVRIKKYTQIRTNVGEQTEKSQFSSTADGNVNWYSPCPKQPCKYLHNSHNSVLRNSPKANNWVQPQKKTYIRMLTVISFMRNQTKTIQLSSHGRKDILNL